MNRYPLWKYIVIVVALVFGAIGAAPNLFDESPALQVSSVKATIKVDKSSQGLVEDALKKGNINPTGVVFDARGEGSVRVRFANTTDQFNAKSLLEKALNSDPTDPTYGVAFNQLPNTPAWLQFLHAAPMNKGLDLRGGVYFLLQLDTKDLLSRHLQGEQATIRNLLHDKNIRHAGISLNGNTIEVLFHDAATLAQAKETLLSQVSELAIADASATGADLKLVVTLKPQVVTQMLDDAVQQNIATLSKRVNEIGVSEPVIQKQGTDRIAVQLPGVQDVEAARRLIGRQATLEVRMVDESVTRGTELTATIPVGSELFKVGRGTPVVLYKDPVVTGDYISGASFSNDQNQQPAVSVDLNGDGGRKMREATRDKIGKPMAIVLFEKGKGEVLTVATIRDELGSHFQITGMGSPEAANELALLLKAGSLAAQMDFVEEKTVGPQLGADNIAKGFFSTVYGFAAIAVFMLIYYRAFGFFSVFALAVNLLLLIAILSVLQATLTLPGIAAIAFTLGMAIDANVLINERIREELRSGNTPQAAIAAGFDRAWATILDSNVTTLIAGLALLTCGSGVIKSFAIVHCLGIITSIFSSVFVSRGLVNLWYGRKKKLTSVAIGQVWNPNS